MLFLKFPTALVEKFLCNVLCINEYMYFHNGSPLRQERYIPSWMNGIRLLLSLFSFAILHSFFLSIKKNY